MRGNRQFMVRAVGFLRDAGIGQFLDIGSGLPSSPNVHEIAQAGGTGARVMYVDHDPVAYAHAGAMTAKNDGTGVVWADLRDTGEVLAGAGKLLDFTQPVGLLFVGCLHHIPDSADPAAWPARYLAALAPGSYLVISHATDEFYPRNAGQRRGRRQQRHHAHPRSKDAILTMFNGGDLVIRTGPGLPLAP